jgi:hypothetical protein
MSESYDAGVSRRLYDFGHPFATDKPSKGLCRQASGIIDTLAQQRSDAFEEITRLRIALQSIAKNTCCDKCMEAAKVAQEALDWGRP